jgi:hypothetical protein
MRAHVCEVDARLVACGWGEAVEWTAVGIGCMVGHEGPAAWARARARCVETGDGKRETVKGSRYSREQATAGRRRSAAGVNWGWVLDVRGSCGCSSKIWADVRSEIGADLRACERSPQSRWRVLAPRAAYCWPGASKTEIEASTPRAGCWWGRLTV